LLLASYQVFRPVGLSLAKNKCGARFI